MSGRWERRVVGWIYVIFVRSKQTYLNLSGIKPVKIDTVIGSFLFSIRGCLNFMKIYFLEGMLVGYKRTINHYPQQYDMHLYL